MGKKCGGGVPRLGGVAAHDAAPTRVLRTPPLPLHNEVDFETHAPGKEVDRMEEREEETEVKEHGEGDRAYSRSSRSGAGSHRSGRSR